MDNTDIPSSDKYNSESVHCDKELLSDIQLAKDTGNIDILISFLSHKNDMVRRNAVIAIGSLRNKQALGERDEDGLVTAISLEECP